MINCHLDVMGYELVLSCSACPEQYDVFLAGERVGYLRLRHGHFGVEYPNCGGELVYEASPIGDGCFEEEERAGYLLSAIQAIDRRHRGLSPYSFTDAQKRIAELETQNQLLQQDKNRLDFLQTQSGYGPWVARGSSTGRGYRLHTTSVHPDARSSVREAIDVAMEAEKTA